MGLWEWHGSPTIFVGLKGKHFDEMSIQQQGWIISKIGIWFSEKDGFITLTDEGIKVYNEGMAYLKKEKHRKKRSLFDRIFR